MVFLVFTDKAEAYSPVPAKGFSVSCGVVGKFGPAFVKAALLLLQHVILNVALTNHRLHDIVHLTLACTQNIIIIIVAYFLPSLLLHLLFH
jgi:hypothetical protein